MKFKYFISVVLCMITGANLQGANQDLPKSEQRFPGSAAEFNAIAGLSANLINYSQSNPHRNSNIDYRQFAGNSIAEYLAGSYNFADRKKIEDNEWRQNATKSFVRQLDRDGMQVQDQNGEFHTVYPNVYVAKNRLGLAPRKRKRRDVEREDEKQRANEAAKDAGIGSHCLEVSKEDDGRAWLITTTKTGRSKQPLITNYCGKSLKPNHSNAAIYNEYALTAQEKRDIYTRQQQGVQQMDVEPSSSSTTSSSSNNSSSSDMIED